MKPLIHRLMTALGCLCAFPVLANLPGGGTNGPNVTLTDNGSTVTLANGTVSIVVTKADASIHQIYYTYNNGAGMVTNQLLASGFSGGKFYWENSNNEGLAFTNRTVADPANNGGNYAEIALFSTTVSNDELEVHYSMLRGATGFYVTPIWSHRSTDGTFSLGECRDNIYAGAQFNWMSVDAARNRLMEVQPGTSAIGVLGAPKEVSLWTNGIYSGRYEDKYKYSADLGRQRAWGWSSVGGGGSNVGLWNITASPEYYNGGPMKRELMEHIGTTILNMLNGSHYGGGTDGSFAAGEVWTKVYGPYLIYCNNIAKTVTDTNQAAQALYSDALAQAAAEATAWPYAWFTNANYTPASGRGTVTGQIAISDSYNPNASAAGLWVGVVQQPSTSSADYDFQKWMKPYQFWVETDTNGNFTIPNVIAGANYTLYAFGPGAAGTFQSQAQTGGSAPNELDIPASPFSVTATAGATNNLGTITWTPTRVGPTVFEIGFPDRTGDKFRHGEDWWAGDLGPSPVYPSPIWSQWLEYPFDFPAGPNYVVGQSRWTTDWNFVQPCVVDSRGIYNDSSATITFNLPAVPGGTASFYMALSSDYQGAIEVAVNGTQIAGSSGYNPAYQSSANESDTTIREGVHGLFSDNRINFSASLLHQGQNTILIDMRQTGKVNGNGYFADHAMYDYIRLELTGYVPPPPDGVTAYAGNNTDLVCWPVQPGATAYNILRSTTAGGGYTPVASGVTGPVCGSGWNNATWHDPTAVNGTTYYYVVQSVNPVGASTNSPSSSGVTPDAGISTSPPAAPTGLTVASSGHATVTLNWSASSGANFYTVYRSTLFDNGGGVSNVLGTVVLANNVTGTTYTDTSPTDGSIYSYSVTATATGGTSGNSNSAVAVPLPAPPAGAPGNLTATPLSVTNITLGWSAVSGAIGYVVQRSTSLNGTYILLNSVTETNYTDFGLNTNLTYYYRITPVNAGGIGTSGLTTTKPAAPAGLAAFAGNAEIFLVWPAAAGATGYVLKRGTSSGNEPTTVASGIAGTNFTDTGLVNGTTYYYVVSATGSAANSGNSPEANATPGALPPPTIAKITLDSGSFILSGTGGFPASTYHVLATTNLALPVAQWTLVATNQFDGSGDFIITNSINPAWPQTFYRLQSQ